MQAHVVVATKGRADEVRALLEWLTMQTLQPASVIVIGTTDSDIVGLEASAFSGSGTLSVILTEAGSCRQRNAGMDRVVSTMTGRVGTPYFVAFFDDDFRPANDWLARARDCFVRCDDVAAITGRVLADGVHGERIDDADATAYLKGNRPARKHWASGDVERPVASVYGCNMAFRESVIERCRFDENLVLYGWQEDQDFTSQSREFGRSVYWPGCRGVHLGSRSGKTSGLRFGYSQIANPLYLARKGTMGAAKGGRFVMRHLVANSVRSVFANVEVDYRGRLRGNLLALTDLVCGRCHPRRILTMA